MRHAIIKKGTTDEIRVYALECRLSERFMDIPQLSVKVSSPIVVNFEIGDYITYNYNSFVYTLRDIPESAKNARPLTYGGAFVYNLVFYGPEWHLHNTPFRDLVKGDSIQHFTSMPDVTTYEDVYGIAARIQACMDDMYPGEWIIRVVSGLPSDSALYLKLSETQDFSISDGKCIDALSQIYSQWGISFIYSYENGKHVITIGGVETQEDVSRLFMYGRGNGLRVIKKSIQNASEIATRFFVYGGTQNMQSRYYNGITASARIESVSGIVPEEKLAFKLSRLKVVGDNMYIPNLMIPFAKWAESRWFVWGDSDNQVFTESREPQIGDYVYMLPNIGSATNLIQQYYSNSDKIVVGGVTYDYLAEIYFPDIRKAYIDAPSQYIAKYGIRPAVLRFDGSNEREDIHPSIKGLTIGNIRAGLSSGAEYYPSESIYTDANERVDEVLSCENPQDDGLSTENGNKYIAEDTVSNTALSGEIKLVPMTQEEGEIPMRGYQTRGMHFILANYANTEVIRKGYLDFQFPLALTVENGNDFNITAEVQVFKTDAAGHATLIINYTTTNQPIKGNPESVIYLNIGNQNGKQLVNEGDKLTISVGITANTTLLRDTLKWSIPAFTMIWRYELSLGEDFYIELKQIGFDISKIQTNDGEYPIISMTSGQCGGYEFDIHDVTYNKSNDSWLLRCARVQDSVLGQWFPNSIFKINADPSNPDTFVLLNIALPGIYIRANEQRLYDAALAERLYEERPLLEPEIDNKVMAESPQVLHAGMWFQVKDSDLGLTGADDDSFYILIDSIEVIDKPDSIRTFKVTLRNERKDNIFTSIQRRVGIISNNISAINKAQTQKSVFYSPTKGGESGNVNTSDFVTLSTAQTITGKKTFAEDAVFGADGGRLFIPSATPGTYDLFVDSGMAIDGDAPAPGGGGLDEDELWRVLQDAGTETISKNHLPSDTLYSDDLNGYARTEDIPSLDGYATQTWVQGQGYITSASLDPYAKTADIQEWVDDNFVRTSELPSLDGYLEWGSVTSPGQYVSVTDDNGVSHNLSLSTHTHKVRDITDFPQTWEWSKISGAPTTLSGYGITDAYTKTQVNEALKAFVTVGTEQTITGDKTFSGDVVFGADGGRMFIPSGDTPGTYDIFVDPGMAVEGEKPSGGGSGEWKTWEDASGADVPVGFHRVTSTFPTSFIKGHIYFFTDTGQLALATGTSSASLSYYSSLVRNVSYNTVSKTLTITPAGEYSSPVTVNLSSFAEKVQLGDLSDLTTTTKTDLVSAINEVAEAVEAGGSGGKVTVTEKIASPQQDYSKIYEISQGGILVGSINIPKDMVVSSGTVEKNPEGKPQGTYLVLTLANATSDKVYINVGSLVDIYTAAKNAPQVQLSINSETREISASIVAGSITTTELASKCVTGAKLADGAVSTSHISNGAVSILNLESSLQTILKNALSASDITTGKTNGSIAVEGKDVSVKGLGSAAYKDEGYFVTVGTEQTITGDKTFSGDVVFGADGGRLFIPSATPGTYDLFVDSGMAIEGEAPSGGDYLLNDLHNLDENATSANIDAAIGGYENLRQAIRNGKVIVDNRTMDYDYDRLVAVDALDGGSENFISLTFHSSMDKTRKYVISRDGSGNLSLTVTDSGSFLSDSHSYSQLDTENKTVLGAINEVAGKVSDALPYWCGRVLSTGQLTKMSGSGNISVRHTAAGVYSVNGASPGMSVTVTPLNFTNSLAILEPLTAAILQNSSNGLITIHIFNSSGSRVNSAFSLLII